MCIQSKRYLTRRDLGLENVFIPNVSNINCYNNSLLEFFFTISACCIFNRKLPGCVFLDFVL